MIPRLWMPVCPCLQRENSIFKSAGHLTDRLCRMMPVGLHIEEIGKAAATLKKVLLAMIFYLLLLFGGGSGASILRRGAD